MDNERYRVVVDGHTLDLVPLGRGHVGEANYCMNCANNKCDRIVWFNKYYHVTLDNRNPGWHVVESK